MSAFRGIYLLFWHNLKLSLRNPVWVLFGLAQPAVFLTLYGPLMTRTLGSSGTSAARAWQIYVPGVLMQLGLFGATFTGFTVIAELRAGVIERLLVAPVSRLALLLGRVLRDVVVLLFQAVLLLLVAIPFGLHLTISGALISLGFVALVSLSLASISSALALILKTEESLGPLFNTVLIPLMLLSGTLLPMALAPGWLNAISRATPFRYVVDAMRNVLTGNIATMAVVEGVAVTIGLCVLSVGMGVRTYLRQGT
jgi:ABC-2 type transport system permease protein